MCSYLLFTKSPTKRPQVQGRKGHRKRKLQILGAFEMNISTPEHAPLVLQSKDVSPTATVIWLHGLGDSPNGWAQTCHMLFKALNFKVKFVIPHAFIQPVACNGGMAMPSWMDLDEIPIKVSSPDRGHQQQQSIDYILSLAAKEVEAGVPANRIVFGGFSQGGALSLAAAVKSGLKIGGCICLSGWALPAQNIGSSIKSAASKDSPFLICHGEVDNIVLTENAPHAATLLREGGAADVSLKTYPGMAHSSCQQEERDILAFLQRVLE